MTTYNPYFAFEADRGQPDNAQEAYYDKLDHAELELEDLDMWLEREEQEMLAATRGFHCDF